MINKQLKDREKIIFFNLSLFLILLWWNSCQPFMGDDELTSAIDVLGKHNLFEVLSSQYFSWTGRMTAEALKFMLESQSYLWLTKPIVKIINSFIVICSINLIYQILFAKIYKFKPYFITATAFIISYIAIGAFASDFIWYTVAIQYAWGFVLILYLFTCFYSEWQTNEAIGFSRLSFYALSALFLGLYNEIYLALILAFVVSLLVSAIVFKFSLRPLFKKQYIVFFLILALAGAFMILAPGNFVRRRDYFSDPAHVAHAANIFVKFLMTYAQFFRYGYHVVAAILLFAIGVWVWKKRQQLPASFIRFMFFLFVLLNVDILSFVGIAYYSPIAGRMNIFLDLIIFLLFAKFLHQYFVMYNIQLCIKFKVFYVALNLAVLVWVSYSYILLDSFYQNRYKQITNARNANIQDVQLPAYCASMILKWPVYLVDINWDKQSLANSGMAKFFGVNSIIVIPCKD